ncbi:ROK family transcriptional regulator [Spongiactinospora sp. TRM90649]|uniref:ROK family transcriptional regulator n=1 Tax=Spongiactinospora sp. TRM90649 TaxID=3031114 RepID=UPI0023F86EC5|nr:ROK family transcriptional regulator [Spongiactinospora sp. TRM90649]MDF5752888.1 ROK family transcriptional regulator [Spongiactinospora sp. TRM90649]
MNKPARHHASTRSAVLDVIRAAGTISRAGLADATGYTAATVSVVVRRLIDDGLVRETGMAESTGGKPRTLLQLNRSARHAIGVHLDHTQLSYVLTDLGGSIIGRMSRPGAAHDRAGVEVMRMAAEIETLIEGVGVDRRGVLGVGVVSPGPCGGVRANPAGTYRRADRRLGLALTDATGLPVITENDATAAALGEYWSGVVGGTSTFAVLYVGVGIGAGVVINGIAHRGPSGNAGEIGHICLDVNGPECRCGARGCAEAMAGPAAVVAAARADQALAGRAGLTGASVAADFAALARAARRGDDSALALLEDSARHLAVLARTLAAVIDLELLILTGPGLATAGPVYLPVVQDELDRAFASRTHSVTVRLSRSAATAPAVGAAAMVLHSELIPLREGLRLPHDLTEPDPVRPAVT